MNSTPRIRTIEVVAPGPQGPAGPPGPPGPPGPIGTIESSAIVSDAHLSHEQSIATDTWTIDHNLGKYPSVTVVDSAGDECEGSVRHISTNQLVISFSAAFAGRAFLN